MLIEQVILGLACGLCLACQLVVRPEPPAAAAALAGWPILRHDNGHSG
jgi:hypothetical protein